jgi:hypothetical protein
VHLSVVSLTHFQMNHRTTTLTVLGLRSANFQEEHPRLVIVDEQFGLAAPVNGSLHLAFGLLLVKIQQQGGLNDFPFLPISL